MLLGKSESGQHVGSLQSFNVGERWQVWCSCGWESRMATTRAEAEARHTAHREDPSNADMNLGMKFAAGSRRLA